MVNSVSGVSNNQNITPSAATRPGVMDKVSQAQLYSPGAYSTQSLLGPLPAQRKKKGSFLGFVGGLVFKAAIVCAALVGARKFLPVLKDANLGKELKEGAKFLDKVKHYTAKSADYIEAKALKAVDFLKSKFSKVAKEAGEATTKA